MTDPTSSSARVPIPAAAAGPPATLEPLPLISRARAAEASGSTLSPLAVLAWAVTGLGGFHLAWAMPSWSPTIVLFPLAVFQLARLRTPRQAFYGGWALGLAAYAPQLSFFWGIFGPAAAVLWAVLAVWLGFVALAGRAVRVALGTGWAALALPCFWMAAEFFRSELYFLRFSWLAVGYAFSESPAVFTMTRLGLYGIGGLVAALGAVAWWTSGYRRALGLVVGAVSLAVLSRGPGPSAPASAPGEGRVEAAGLQLEFPAEDELFRALDRLAARYPAARLLVLSEYSLQGPPSPALRAWCRRQQRYVVIGGKDPLEGEHFRNTAFVVDPAGEIVFRQGKSVPIQFFQDGDKALERGLWNSPWGRVGLAICYDLSYRRVMDDFVRQGAQALIIPTADCADWGVYQHQLHARVARVRAAEYGLPILRVASSGISQHVEATGREVAQAPFPGQGEMLSAGLVCRAAGRVPWDAWLAPAALVLSLGWLTAAVACRGRPA